MHETVEAKETLNRFFQSLDNYLENDDGETGISTQLPYKGILNTGIESCEECSKIMESFCQLHQQLKQIQFQISQKLLRLGDIMAKPAKMKEFRDSVKQLGHVVDADYEETVDFIIEFKRDLMKECSRKLSCLKPRVLVQKLDQEESEVGHSDNLEGNRNLATRDQRPRQLTSDDDPPTSESPDADFTLDEVDDSYNDPEPSPPEVTTEMEDGDKSQRPKSCPPEGNPEYVKVPTVLHRKPKAKSTRNRRKCTGVPPSTSDIPPPSISQLEFGEPESTFDPSTNQYKCTRCPQLFPRKQSSRFGFHFRRDHLKVRYSCSTCLQQFSTRQVYNRHYLSSHKGQKFICDKCGVSLAHHSALWQHLRATKCGESQSSTPLAKYSCEVCGKEFARRNNVKMHMKAVHLKLREHLCDLCGTGYKLKGDLNRHRRRVHGSQPQMEIKL